MNDAEIKAQREALRRRDERKELASIALLGLLSGDCAKSMGDISQLDKKMPLSKVAAIMAISMADSLIAELDKQVDQPSKPPEDVL